MNKEGLRTALSLALRIEKKAFSISFDVLSAENKDNYQQQLISYLGYEHDFIYAYLLIPYGDGPFPAVLVHHQHNSEWHLGKSEVCGIKGDPLQAFGPRLAAMGFIVLAPDSVGFEDRRRNQRGTSRNEKSDWLQYYNGMAYRLLRDRYLMTTILQDAAIGITVLAAHPETDKSKIGLLGHSYGGTTSLFQAAVDERVSFVCASGAAGSFKNKMASETGIEMSLVIPGFVNQYDIADVIRCILPRPLLLLSADEDIYSEDAIDIVNELDEGVEPVGLEHVRYNGGHSINEERTEMMMNWMKLRK